MDVGVDDSGADGVDANAFGGDVGAGRNRAPSGRGDLIDEQLGGGTLRTIVHADGIGARGGEPSGGGANPPTAAGDEHDSGHARDRMSEPAHSETRTRPAR